MASTPLVSVVIPTYERATLVGRAMRSVLNQTMGDLELLVVDDGSRDNTEEVIRGWGDPRITYLKHEHNMGSSAARNTGIRQARGTYIGLLDSDDEWLPGKLEKQLGLFAGPSLPCLGAVNCGLIVDRGDELPRLSWTPSTRGWVLWSALAVREWYDTASMWLIKKEYLSRLEGPFDPRLPYVQVSDLIVRLAAQCQVDHANELLLLYHDHGLLPRNQLYPIDVRIASYRCFMAKHEQHLAQRPDIRGRLLTVCATLYLAEQMNSEARQCLDQALRVAPLNRRTWALWALERFHPKA